MTATPAPAHALPGSDTPVIPAHRIADGDSGPVARDAAPDWPLIPMNANPGVTHSTIHWPTFPSTFREEMRLVAWTLINGELPAVFLRERHPTWRSRQAPKALCQTIGTWCRLAVWLTDRGITTLSDCTTQVLGKYGRHLRDSGAARITLHSVLSSLARLWVFDQLSGRPSGIGRPPWETEGVDDYLPSATPGGENTVETIAEQTMGPLLVWAIRTVDEFSDDILSAWAERNRLHAQAAANSATPASRAALRAFMDRTDADQLPIPTTQWLGRTRIAGDLFAEARDEDGNHRSEGEVRDAPSVGTAPSSTPSASQSAWFPQGSCCSTTTPTTCAAPAPSPCTPWELGSRTSSPGPTTRQPPAGWPTRSSRRIRTAGSELSGSAGTWPGTSPRRRPGRARDSVRPSADVRSSRICRAQPGRHPRPPRRRYGPRHHRHRRRPERRPRGRLRHLRARRTPRHQGRRRAPVHRHRHHRTAARQILANPHLALYDNPHTLLMCVYKRDKALCHRGLKDTPSLDQCVPACANIARTDQHATGLRLRATTLAQQAGHVPGPLGERLRGNAARLRDLADTHHRTRTTLQDGTA